MRRKRRFFGLNEPLPHPDHRRPVTRRDFIAQGFVRGGAMVLGPTIFGLFANPRAARAALSPDLEALRQSCGIAVQGAGKIPFICVDLAGGANIAGSNVLALSPAAAQTTAFRRDYEERARELAEEAAETVEDPAAALFADEAAREAAEARALESARRQKAIMQGYTGNMCTECQNFTMVRNGTCEKCDTCGATSGCS